MNITGGTTQCPTCRGTGRLDIPGPPPPKEAVGARLTALVTERGISQTHLAQRMGRSQPTISQWLAGLQRPGYDDLCSLADLFGTTTDYLIGRTGDT